ncbi:MAG TPA: TadE family type IV pilus minor pilin [Propionibacteriaceae bacterium]|nr:TadE family type IV pilus minor pilin [Propionibacteriaceae bacterium]
MTLRKIRAQDARGMVTAELAVTTLAAFAVLTMMCWGIYLVVTQLRCIDAAAAVARQAARGDTTAVGKAKAAAPTGATISIDKRPSLVTVIVRVRARPLGRWLPAVPLEARAQVVPEPTATEGP